MESQQIAPHDHYHAHHHEPHNVALHHQGLKKVKAKAKKIKDTITKHEHSHDRYDYEDEEEDGDEDGVGVGVGENPELQGTLLYEGAAMRSAVAGQWQHQDVGIGMSTAMHNQPPPAPRETTSRPTAVETGFTSVNKPTTKVDSSAVAPNTTISLTSTPWSLEEDPHAPKDKTHPHPRNSEVKVSDPARTGNEEAGDSKIFESFAKIKVNDEDEPNRTGMASGIHGGGNESSYAQKISAVGSAASGKAVAAKDFVASKLGYGETTEDNPNTNTNTNTKSSSPLEYGKKIALTVTEKLKPGEDDKALSEAISGAFYRRKEEIVKVGESAFRHPKCKVTESEELAWRLRRDGSEGTERSSAVSAATSTVRSMADMVKDTVGSWLGKAGNQSPPSQQSLGTSQGVEGFMDSSAVGEGRRRRQEPGGTEAEVRVLQESTN